MGLLSPTDAIVESGDGGPDPEVGLDEFFDPAFLARHSQFSSFDEFAKESPWTITEWSDIDEIAAEDLDTFVAETTEFESWRQLRNRAAGRELRDRLLV